MKLTDGTQKFEALRRYTNAKSREPLQVQEPKDEFGGSLPSVVHLEFDGELYDFTLNGSELSHLSGDFELRRLLPPPLGSASAV